MAGLFSLGRMNPFFLRETSRAWTLPLIVLFACAPVLVLAQPDMQDRALLSRQSLAPIFNGTNLDGWISRGGKASYEVQDAVIVGTVTVKGGGNTFLCTEKEYGDFILELEIKADKELNSGVQIRSHCFDQATTYDFGHRTIRIPAKRVHGYQIEVDNRPERRWSGGVYDEARRDWLFPLGKNSAAGQAFKFGDWNKYRIQCIGSSIKTWINDVPAADLVDAETLRGFIGLQVHGSDQPELQVRFRNIRIADLGERQWVTAWDCRSMDGLNESGPAQWKLEDGVARVTQAAAVSEAGKLTGNMALQEFTVRFKYKIAKGGFNLTFQPESGAKAQSASFSFGERIGVTNVAHVQDWNTVVASVQPTRFVVILNGHKVTDAADLQLGKVLPGFEFPAGPEAEVSFKDFEILAPKE
jgi:hypothetical protein